MPRQALAACAEAQARPVSKRPDLQHRIGIVDILPRRFAESLVEDVMRMARDLQTVVERPDGILRPGDVDLQIYQQCLQAV